MVVDQVLPDRGRVAAGGQDGVAGFEAGAGEAMVDVVGREQAEAAVAVVVVVPGEEVAAVGAAVLDGPEAAREVGPVWS